MLKTVNKNLYSGEGNTFADRALNILIGVIIAVFIGMLVFNMTFSCIYVVGPSMEPTLNGAVSESVSGGDYVYANKLKKPRYGDIVIVEAELDKGNGVVKETIIKRVIALAGDRVKLDHGVLYIKYAGKDEFEQVDEPYLSPDKNDFSNENNTFPKKGYMLDSEGYLVKEGYFFVMGDNRNVSLDSRTLGALPLENLYGVVPKWSVNNKQFITSMRTFFTFGRKQKSITISEVI